jgi:hypothetical protein
MTRWPPLITGRSRADQRLDVDDRITIAPGPGLWLGGVPGLQLPVDGFPYRGCTLSVHISTVATVRQGETLF